MNKLVRDPFEIVIEGQSVACDGIRQEQVLLVDDFDEVADRVGSIGRKFEFDPDGMRKAMRSSAGWRDYVEKLLGRNVALSALLVLPLAACSGGGGGGGGGGVAGAVGGAVGASLGGMIIDPPISGAKVEFWNGSRKLGEVVSNSDGTYNYTVPVGEIVTKVVALAGTGRDIVTGEALPFSFSAPKGSTVVTPLTTLVDQLMQKDPNLSVSAAQSALKKVLNIQSNLDLTTYNPVTAGQTSDLAKQAEAAAVLAAGIKLSDSIASIVKSVVGASGLPNSDSTEALLSASALSAIADFTAAQSSVPDALKKSPLDVDSLKAAIGSVVKSAKDLVKGDVAATQQLENLNQETLAKATLEEAAASATSAAKALEILLTDSSNPNPILHGLLPSSLSISKIATLTLDGDLTLSQAQFLELVAGHKLINPVKSDGTYSQIVLTGVSGNISSSTLMNFVDNHVAKVVLSGDAELSYNQISALGGNIVTLGYALQVDMTGADASEVFTINAPDAGVLTFKGNLGAGADQVVIKLADPNPSATDVTTLKIDSSGLSALGDTLVFDFANKLDKVVLEAGSNMSGFSAIEVRHGTIDATQVQLPHSFDVIINSGLVVTADQFMAMSSIVSVTGLGALSVKVSTALDIQHLVEFLQKNSNFIVIGSQVDLVPSGSVTSNDIVASGFSTELSSHSYPAIPSLQHSIVTLEDSVAALNAVQRSIALTPTIEEISRHLSDGVLETQEGPITVRVHIPTGVKVNDTIGLYSGSTALDLNGSGTGKGYVVTANDVESYHDFTIQQSELGAGGATDITAKIISGAIASKTSAPIYFTFSPDSHAPDAVAINVKLSQDTGLVGDFATSVALQRLSGSITEALNYGEKVQVKIDGGSWADAPVDLNTLTWSYLTQLNAGHGTIWVRTIDAAGNYDEKVVFEQSYTLDQTRPDKPIIIDDEDGEPDGKVLTNNSMPALHITAETGTTVAVSVGGAYVGDAVEDGQTGNFTFSFSDENWELNEGVNHIRATATDAAGNVSQLSVVQNLTVDTLPPSAPAFAIVSDTASPSDGVTQNGQMKVWGLEANATWEYSLDAGDSWHVGSGSTFIADDAHYGVGDILVIAKDRAGNVSLSAQNAAAITVDGTGPANAEIISAPSEGYYKVGDTLTFVVRFDEAVLVTGKPYLMLSNGKVASYDATHADTDPSTGALVFTYTVQAGDDTSNLTIGTDGLDLNKGHIRDAAGNEAALTLTASFDGGIVVDTIAPSEPSISGISDDSGSAGDFITNFNQGLTVTVRLEAPLGAGETLQYRLSNDANWTDIDPTMDVPDVVGMEGFDPSISFSAPLLTTTNTILLRVIDMAGNSSPVASQLVVIDHDAPSAEASILALSFDAGLSSSDFVTNAALQIVSGHLNADLARGEKVQVSANSTDGIDGIWSDASVTSGGDWQSIVRLQEGEHHLYSRTVDAAGNSNPGAYVEYTLDTAPPSAAPGALQYASTVLDVSSAFGTGIQDFSAQQVIGAPDVKGYSDNGAAWAPHLAEMDAEQFIKIGFASPVHAAGLVIRETYGAGFVTKVQLFDVLGALRDTIDVDDTSVGGDVNQLRITFPDTPYLVSAAKVYIDTSADDWEEIDSVGLLSSVADAQILPITAIVSDVSSPFEKGDTLKINFSKDVVVDQLLKGSVFNKGVLTLADEYKLGSGYSVEAGSNVLSSTFTITLGQSYGSGTQFGDLTERTLTFSHNYIVDAAGNLAANNVEFIVPEDVRPPSFLSSHLMISDINFNLDDPITQGSFIVVKFSEAVLVVKLSLGSFGEGFSSISALNPSEDGYASDFKLTVGPGAAYHAGDEIPVSKHAVIDRSGNTASIDLAIRIDPSATLVLTSDTADLSGRTLDPAIGAIDLNGQLAILSVAQAKLDIIPNGGMFSIVDVISIFAGSDGTLQSGVSSLLALDLDVTVASDGNVAQLVAIDAGTTGELALTGSIVDTAADFAGSDGTLKDGVSALLALGADVTVTGDGNVAQLVAIDAGTTGELTLTGAVVDTAANFSGSDGTLNDGVSALLALDLDVNVTDDVSVAQYLTISSATNGSLVLSAGVSDISSHFASSDGTLNDGVLALLMLDPDVTVTSAATVSQLAAIVQGDINGTLKYSWLSDNVANLWDGTSVNDFVMNDSKVSVVDSLASASFLQAIDAASDIVVDAASVGTISGSASQIASIVSAATIDTSVNVGINLSAGEVQASDLLKIEENTSAMINATAVNSVLGSAEDVWSAVTSDHISLSNSFNASLTGTASVVQLSDIKALTQGIIVSQNIADDYLSVATFAVNASAIFKAATGSVSVFGSFAGDTINMTPVGVSHALTILAGDGNDVVIGSALGDIIYGESGDDVLYGSKGNDTLYGGDGADTFKFDAGDTGNITSGSIYDVVMDYVAGLGGDKLDFGKNVKIASDGLKSVAAEVGHSGSDINASVANGVLSISGNDASVVNGSLEGWLSVAKAVDKTPSMIVAFKFSTDTYIYEKNSATNSDLLIQLNGVSDIDTLSHTSGIHSIYVV